MYPVPFDYHSPDTLDGALELLPRHGDEAKVLTSDRVWQALNEVGLAE